jgi:hypothetical protein
MTDGRATRAEKGGNAMSKLHLLLAGTVILGLAAVTTRAEAPADTEAAATNLEVLIDAIRANRKALIAVNLGLTAEEAARFWPLYDRYAGEIHATGDRVTTVVERYTASFQSLSNEEALELVEKYLAAEGDRIKVRQAYIPEFAKVLPGRTVARFYQIENKMDAVIRYDLAAAIPVVEEGTRGPAK